MRYSAATGIATTLFLLSTAGSFASQIGPDDRDTIEMLRDAQVTNRAALRQGHATVQLSIAKKGVATPASIEGVLTWSDSDFLLKYKISDPSKVYFKSKNSDPGGGWHLLLRTRDEVRIYNPNTGASYTRKSGPSSFDPVFDLNPWVQLFACCPPSADPALGGVSWVELIGPHPSLKGIMESSQFEYSTLPDNSIKQTRRDRGGFTNEIIFSSANNYLISSMIQRDAAGSVEQEGKFQYLRAGQTVVPLECEFYLAPGGASPVLTLTYKYSNCDVRKRVAREELSAGRFVRMTKELNPGTADPSIKKRPVGIPEGSLRSFAEKLRKNGFAVPQ
jgi:hypothetical protein